MAGPESSHDSVPSPPGFVAHWGPDAISYLPEKGQGAYAVVAGVDEETGRETYIGYAPPGIGFNQEEPGPRDHWRKGTWNRWEDFCREIQPEAIGLIRISDVLSELPDIMGGFVENRTRSYLSHHGMVPEEQEWPDPAVCDQVLRNMRAELELAIEEHGE